MNQPDTPTISVDEPSVARVSMLVKGSFGHKLEDITSYGVEFSDVLFEKDGTYTVLTPQEVTEDGFSLGITNLTPNKTYYLRSFISNGHSSLYSSVLTQKMPETSVASVSDVSLSADGNYLVAMIEDDGGRSVEDVGFVWGDTNDRRALRREKRYPATIGLDGRTFTLPVSALGNKTRYVLAYAEDDKEATGFSRIALERFVAEDEPSPTQPYNEIWYTSTDGEIIEPDSRASFGDGVTLVSNTYEDGQGVMTFSGPVTEIGDWSFYAATRLNSIVLPESVVSIGSYSFDVASFETIHIPDNVISIAEGCFSNCWHLNSFTGKYVSRDGKALIVDGTMVAFAPAERPQEYTVDASVKVLGNSAFSDCTFLEKIHFPEGLERINNSCFHQCFALTQVEFPSSLKYIERGAFARCQNLTSIAFPEGEFTVMRDAFDHCPKLTSLSGNYISQDGRSMIQDNTLVCVALAGLEEYVVPDGVTSTCTIHGFQDGLKSLKRIVYPETVTKIGQIWDCESLQSITIKATTPPSFNITSSWVDDRTVEFYNTNDCPIYVPAEAVESYKSAEKWGTYADRIQPIVEGQPTNEIWYTSTDGEIVVPNNANDFGATLVSNTYNNGIGVFEFDAPVTMIGYHAFSGCKNLVEIHIPSLVTSIGEEAFASCISLNWPTIPESVTQIGNSAFYGCESFTVVGFPSTVTELGNSVFQNCQNLTSITGKWASDDNKCLIIDGTLNSFAHANLGDSYSFPESVTTVGDSALRNCHYSGNLSFGSTLLRIESQAFAHAYYIKSIQLGESVEYIGDQAFNGFGVKNLVLPASLKAIGSGALANWFQSVTLSAKTPPVAADAHIFETEYNTYDEFPVYVPAESVEAYKTAEYWSAYASRFQAAAVTNEIWYTSTDGNVIEPDSRASFGTGVSLISNTYENGQGIMTFSGPVTEIGDWSFYSATRLSSIVLPESVVSIGAYSFNVASFETIHIPDNVSSIAEGCFSNCWNLTSFTGKYVSEDGKALILDGTMVAFAPGEKPQEYTVDASVKVLGMSAFSDCYFLEKIHFPEGLERIKNSCFHQCWGLTQIEFPSSLKYIERGAFARCENLSSLVFPDSEFTVMRDAFHQCPKLASLSGNYVSRDGRSMVQDNTLVCVALAGLEEYVIPAGITSTCTIHGFQDGLKSLKRLIYPDTVTQIGQIWDCEGLESITINTTTPPSFIIIMSWVNDNTVELYNTNDCAIYVPAEALESYKTATGWSIYADRVQAIQ